MAKGAAPWHRGGERVPGLKGSTNGTLAFQADGEVRGQDTCGGGTNKKNNDRSLGIVIPWTCSVLEMSWVLLHMWEVKPDLALKA
eukprot:3369669-Pyramimonas_sp.AAC.1